MSSEDKIKNLLPLPLLKTSRLCVIGLGTMGSSVLEQLAIHKVGIDGEIFIIDGDKVEERNVVGTPYRKRHIGMSKVDAMEEILNQLWYESSRIVKVPSNINLGMVKRIPHDSFYINLLCLFADDENVISEISKYFYSTCTMIRAFFGRRSDFGIVSYSIPNRTSSLNKTLTSSKRNRQTISRPEALGTDTSIITNYVANLCLSLLIPNKTKEVEELLPKLYSNATLHAIGLRHTWIFEDLEENNPMSVFIVKVPT